MTSEHPYRLAGGRGTESRYTNRVRTKPESGFDEVVVKRISTDNEICRNEVADCENLAIAFDNETGDTQRHARGNDLQGETNGSPEVDEPGYIKGRSERHLES